MPLLVVLTRAVCPRLAVLALARAEGRSGDKTDTARCTQNIRAYKQVLLDARNDYETQFGTFANAVCSMVLFVASVLALQSSASLSLSLSLSARARALCLC